MVSYYGNQCFNIYIYIYIYIYVCVCVCVCVCVWVCDHVVSISIKDAPVLFTFYCDVSCFADKTYLFVTSKPDNVTYTVEKFSFDKKCLKLYHIRTYKNPTFTQLVLLIQHIHLLIFNYGFRKPVYQFREPFWSRVILH